MNPKHPGNPDFICNEHKFVKGGMILSFAYISLLATAFFVVTMFLYSNNREKITANEKCTEKNTEEIKSVTDLLKKDILEIKMILVELKTMHEKDGYNQFKAGDK